MNGTLFAVQMVDVFQSALSHGQVTEKEKQEIEARIAESEKKNSEDSKEAV